MVRMVVKINGEDDEHDGHGDHDVDDADGADGADGAHWWTALWKNWPAQKKKNRVGQFFTTIPRSIYQTYKKKNSNEFEQTNFDNQLNKYIGSFDSHWARNH